MRACTKLLFFTFCLVVSGCGELTDVFGGGPQAELLDVEYETPTPAAAVIAEQDESLDAPVDPLFDEPLETQAGVVDGVLYTDLGEMPQWYCPKSVVTRAQMASFIVRITHQGKSIPDPVGRFSDVPVSHTHARSIEQFARDGITRGCDDERFCPDSAVTRGQMATFLVRVVHGTDYRPPAPTGMFSDVPRDMMFAANIEQLARDGITQGCGGGNFCPDDYVTREQMATFLVRALLKDRPNPSTTGSFADVAASNTHRANIEKIAAERVTVGCGAPPATYEVNGYNLNARQQEWLRYFAGRAMPRLRRVLGDSRALTVGSRTVWWSLKEGVFGSFADPFGYSNCNTSSGDRRIGAFDTCGAGRAWQVGLAGIQVPNWSNSAVEGAARALYPEAAIDELLSDLVTFGDALAGGAYPSNALARVQANATLERSWLQRDAAVGSYLIISAIERECINSSRSWCFGTGWDSTRKFAPNRSGATRAQADLKAILHAMRPR